MEKEKAIKKIDKNSTMFSKNSKMIFEQEGRSLNIKGYAKENDSVGRLEDTKHFKTNNRWGKYMPCKKF